VNTTKSLQQVADPTGVMYTELTRAFAHFNERLFQGILPACLITLPRERNTFGYFSYRRYVRSDGEGMTHEIAINPSYVTVRSIKQSLSTLVHEMVHLNQACFGRHKSRKSYHNFEWSQMMVGVGLQPSDTGAPGGKAVGERMTHYIIEGGLFDRAATELLDDHFTLSWIDRLPLAVPLGMHLPANYKQPSDDELARVPGELSSTLVDGGHPNATHFMGADGQPNTSQSLVATVPTKIGIDQPDPAEMPEVQFRGAVSKIAFPSDAANRSNREKYHCSGCKVNVWGKLGLSLICGQCSQPFFPVKR